MTNSFTNYPPAIHWVVVAISASQKLKSFQKENEKLEKRLCLITERRYDVDDFNAHVHLSSCTSTNYCDLGGVVVLQWIEGKQFNLELKLQQAIKM